MKDSNWEPDGGNLQVRFCEGGVRETGPSTHEDVVPLDVPVAQGEAITMPEARQAWAPFHVCDGAGKRAADLGLGTSDR